MPADAPREAPPAARVRPGLGGAPATSTSPTRTTAATTASSTCSTSSRRPAAGCSTRCAPTGGCDRRGGGAARWAPACATPRRVAGGDINDAWRVELEDGRRAFVKARAGARPGEYATEAAGLRWLGEVDGRARRARGARGRRRRSSRSSGSTRGGSTPAARRSSAAGSRASTPRARRRSARRRRARRRGPAARGGRAGGGDEGRLAGVLRRAPARRRCCARRPIAARCPGTAAIERAIERLPELAGPPEPPARLHGDLWSGNVLAGRDGAPAAHRPRRVRRPSRDRPRDAAAVRRAVAAHARGLRGGRTRSRPATRSGLPLWQLLPLLVHAVLFGGGYGAAAVRAARRAAR